MEKSFNAFDEGLLEEPWVMDLGVTVKPLFGRQEGALAGYNPAAGASLPRLRLFQDRPPAVGRLDS